MPDLLRTFNLGLCQDNVGRQQNRKSGELPHAVFPIRMFLSKDVAEQRVGEYRDVSLWLLDGTDAQLEQLICLRIRDARFILAPVGFCRND